MRRKMVKRKKFRKPGESIDKRSSRVRKRIFRNILRKINQL
jgi:hypothetical protein